MGRIGRSRETSLFELILHQKHDGKIPPLEFVSDYFLILGYTLTGRIQQSPLIEMMWKVGAHLTFGYNQLLDS